MNTLRCEIEGMRSYDNTGMLYKDGCRLCACVTAAGQRTDRDEVRPALLEDKTFSGLCDALDAHDAEEAFRMAHTLKGICLNLGFEPLRQASSELTEELRGRDLSVDYADAFQAVKTRYQQTVSAIRGIAG